MQVHRSIEDLPVFRNAVITIGTFDGVHQGHKSILTALKQQAVSVNGESVIITFHPHPRKIVKPNEPLQLINTLDEKLELLALAGIDHVVVVPFTASFSELSAEEYISDFLVNKFHPHTVIIGYDHHFGKGRTGNFQLLEKKATVYHYHLIEIPKQVLDHIDVSSTKIRNSIWNSDVETANKLLGYDFYFAGSVIRGDQLGRKLGYPTANLEYSDPEKIRLGHGVFACYVRYNQQLYKGMLSVGNRPTLTHSDERVEVNIFDFDQEIYGESLQVYVRKFLRPQVKYESLEIMVNQLHQDKKNSLAVL
jgi:riboflavin kinase / FMN adenylyltransferase